MTGEKSKGVSSYWQYLPAYLQNDVILGQFLLAFEKILSGKESEPEPSTGIIHPESNPPSGYEEVLARISTYFIPHDANSEPKQQCPEEFIPWLASWVALSLREDWDVNAKRAFLSRVVPLYQYRGTKVGLEQMLEIYMKNSRFPDKVSIKDDFEERPNYFQVELTLSNVDPEEYARQQQIAMAIINHEKPVHTYYGLKIWMKTMQITTEDKSHKLTIGKLTDGKFCEGNTILGSKLGDE